MIQLMLAMIYLVLAPVLLLGGAILKLIGYLITPRGLNAGDRHQRPANHP